MCIYPSTFIIPKDNFPDGRNFHYLSSSSQLDIGLGFCTLEALGLAVAPHDGNVPEPGLLHPSGVGSSDERVPKDPNSSLFGGKDEPFIWTDGHVGG